MIEAAILGLGGWGRQVVDAVDARSDAIRISTALVTDPSRHEAYARAHGLRLEMDYERILANPAIDAVVITTPNTLHAEQTLRAAQAGKHVLCEKPFTSTLDEARHVFAATDAAGIACVVDFQRRFLAPYQALAERIAAGAIGMPCHVECNQSADAGFRFGGDSWRASGDEFRGGGIAGHGIHMIDAVIGLFGPFASLSATALRRVPDVHIDDTTFLTFTLESGITGYIGTMMASADEHRLQVFGSDGWIEMRDHRLLTFQPRGGAREQQDFGAPDIVRAALERFAGVVAGTAEWPVSRADALAGQAAYDAVARSVASGDPVVLRS